MQESDSNHMAIFATPTHNMERQHTVSVRDMLYISTHCPLYFLCLICALTLNILITMGLNTMMLGTER